MHSFRGIIIRSIGSLIGFAAPPTETYRCTSDPDEFPFHRLSCPKDDGWNVSSARGNDAALTADAHDSSRKNNCVERYCLAVELHRVSAAAKLCNTTEGAGEAIYT